MDKPGATRERRLMRRLLASLTTALVLACLAPAAVQAADGTLTGRVGVDAATPVPGARFQLTPSTPVKFLETDAAGRYFLSLPEGAYTLQLVEGYRMIAPATNTVAFTIVAGQETVLDWTVRGSRVHGRVFDDFDADGIQDPGEVPLAGVSVKILAARDFYVTTGADGVFASGPPVLPAGTFGAGVFGPSGYSDGSPPSRAVELGEDLDFGAIGLHTPTGFVEGSVYVEQGAPPGRQDYEDGIPGVEVTAAYTLGGAAYSRTVDTDADGRFRIGVAAGRPLTITQSQPAHWADGGDFTPVPGAVSGNDSFTAPGVAEGASSGPFDFGERASTLRVHAFIDYDRDGIWDPDRDVRTGPVTVLVTGPDGFAEELDTDFGGSGGLVLPGGKMTVTISQPLWGTVPGPAQTVDVPLGGSATVYAPFFTTTLEGTVRDTTTGAPVGGATVTYRDASSDEKREVESGADGGFRFDSLLVTEAAELRVTAPPGFVLSDSVAGSLGGTAVPGGVTGFALGPGALGTGFVLGLASPATDVPPTPTPTPTTDPPAHAPPPSAPRAAARVMLVARARTSLSGNGSRLGCRLDAGAIRRCDFAIRTPGGRLLATASATSDGDVRRLDAMLRLTPLGRRLTRRAPGGVAAIVFLRATQAAGGGVLEARRRTLLVRPGRHTVPGTIFAPGTARLTAGGRDAIRALVGRLAGARRVVCEGHTDSIGTEADNHALGLARARTVCAALRAAGLRDTRLIARSRGETRPVASNLTAAGREHNRRVVLRAVVR